MILESQNFAAIDEANAFLPQLLNEGGGRLSELPADTPLAQAQALIYQAHESGSQTPLSPAERLNFRPAVPTRMTCCLPSGRTRPSDWR